MDNYVENKDNFKVIHRYRIVVWVILVLIAVFMITYGGIGQKGNQSSVAMKDSGEPRTDIIRFHVRANSNSKEDQELKLKVRNEIISKLQVELEEAVSPKSIGVDVDMEERSRIIRQYVENNLDKIEGWALAVIEEEGYDYEISSNVGVSWIPEKTYDGILFPAGNYEALTVNIGSGEGENWWCVIFPPLCLVGDDEALVEEEQLEEEPSKALLFELGKENRLILKSRILEILNGE